MLNFHNSEEFKECASGENNISEDARKHDVDVDDCFGDSLPRICRCLPVNLPTGFGRRE